MSSNQQILLGEGAGGAPVVYVEDVFSCFLYTGNSSTQTITTGIDLSTKGGMIWQKPRTTDSYNNDHKIFDTARGQNNVIYPNLTSDQNSGRPLSYTASGFTLDAGSEFYGLNESAKTYASWTFREQPKFFDVVTWTGDGAASRNIAHTLGSQPGFIVCKQTDGSGAWPAAHRGDGATGVYGFVLNSTGQGYAWADYNTYMTSTTFDPTQLSGGFNTSAATYVAYLFAHNAGGFGLAGTDNVISCGSYTGAGSPYTGGSEVTLGYEPQWVLIKSADNATNWVMIDNMRGWEAGTSGLQNWLYANTSGAENTGGTLAYITSTGFKPYGSSLTNNTGTYIYIAIRRGPMKVPTVGTSVFSPQAFNSPTNGTQVTTGFPIDLSMFKARDGGPSGQFQDRLRGLPLTAGGGTPALYPDATAAESTNQTGYEFWNTGYRTYTAQNAVWWMFQRAPGFFDEVCYTGTATASLNTITHNLGVIPELIIIKSRSGVGAWAVMHSFDATNVSIQYVNTTAAAYTDTYANIMWVTQKPTATQFILDDISSSVNSALTYVAYLFATCAGVSKVGSYTGNGSNQTIACGFAAGSRFVMIKRTDSTGDWYVWDSARGIVAGNDPHLSLNTTAAEVTTDDSVDTDNSGFIVNQLSATNINVTSATYIFLAIA